MTIKQILKRSTGSPECVSKVDAPGQIHRGLTSLNTPIKPTGIHKSSHCQDLIALEREANDANMQKKINRRVRFNKMVQIRYIPPRELSESDQMQVPNNLVPHSGPSLPRVNACLNLRGLEDQAKKDEYERYRNAINEQRQSIKRIDICIPWSTFF